MGEETATEPKTDADETDADDQDDSQGADDKSNADGESSGGEEDISSVTAPSVGPNTTFEREDPEERLARHEQSDTDAIGLDKRREVIGGSYGPSVGKQAVLYGSVLAITALLVIGFILLAGKLDQPPDTVEDRAPWATEPEAGQEPPDPIQ